MTGYMACIHRKYNWCIKSIEESCGNDGEHTEKKKRCESANYLLNSSQLLHGLYFRFLIISAENTA